MTNTLTRLAITAALAGSFACAAATVGTSSAGLEGPQWKLARIGGSPARGLTSPRPAYVRFVPDSLRVEGFGGCNRISGIYSRTGDLLSMGALISTRMACVDDALNAQEQAFTALLGDARRFAVEKDTLRLYDGASVLRAVLVR